MCGRFALYAPRKLIKAQFHLDELFEIEPRYNIAPTEDIVALTQVEGRGLSATMFQWGLIPSWADDRKIASKLINARSESVAEKPAFRQAFKKRRCIVIMSGFFEWQTIEKTKQPYFIKPEQNQLIAVAGLWEDWISEDGESIKSCCLLTRSANEFMKPIHDRMPVMLDESQQKIWLNIDTKSEDLQSLLDKPSHLKLVNHPVTTQMNYAGFKSPQAIEPINL